MASFANAPEREIDYYCLSLFEKYCSSNQSEVSIYIFDFLLGVSLRLSITIDQLHNNLKTTTKPPHTPEETFLVASRERHCRNLEKHAFTRSRPTIRGAHAVS